MPNDSRSEECLGILHKKRPRNMKKEYNFSKMKAIKNPYAFKKKAIGINLSHQVIDYFKKLSIDSGIPYQTLIDLYLLDCVKQKRKPKLNWAA